VAMSIPSWLYYLFGALMLAVAAYGLVLLVLGEVTRRFAGWDVEISHIFMGVSMAGMFVGRWAFGKNTAWEIIFSLLMIWFLYSAIQSVLHYGLHLPHSLIHAVMSFAMLLMYWYPIGGSEGSMDMSMSMHMSMSSSTGGQLDPGLALLLAVIFCASAIFTLASPIKGRSHFGSHAPAYVYEGPGRDGPTESPSDEVSESLVALEQAIAAPRLVDVSHAVICVAMAFIFVLMT
jgi:hypothetical protein